MSRFTRNQVLQVKREATYGTNPGSWAASNTIPLRQDAPPQINRQRFQQQRVRGAMGGFSAMDVTGTVVQPFEVELGAAATAGTAPRVGDLLVALGMGETITAGNRVEYSPVSTDHSSVYFRSFEDGLMTPGAGARGTGRLMLSAMTLPLLSGELTGLGTTAPSAVATPNYQDWTGLPPINEDSTARFLLGAAYSAGTLTGGTSLPFTEVSIDLGWTVQHQQIVNDQSIDLTDRSTTIQGTVFFNTADEVSQYGLQRANTIGALSFTVGTNAGFIFIAHIANAQRRDIRAADYQGRRMVAVDFESVAASTPELILCFR